MTRQTLTTAEAAHVAGVDPRSFARWARQRGIEPVHRVRVGRSYVTCWPIKALIEGARRVAT